MLLRGFRGIMKLYEIFHAMDKSSMKVTLNLDQFFFFKIVLLLRHVNLYKKFKRWSHLFKIKEEIYIYTIGG
jgi:hypothetical protein